VARSLRTIFTRILRHNSPTLRSRGSVVRRFAEKVGLVYFGSVDQYDDEHEIIRGLTASTTHQDSHYAVGAYDGYDISMVDRFDVIVDPQGHATEHMWLIIRINLETQQTLPHFFLAPVGHSPHAYNKFYNAYTHLKAINTQFSSDHSHEFHARYQLHAASAHIQAIESLFTPSVTHTIAARFWPHAIEFFDGSLYLYTTDTKLTSTLLESSLESAVWLARAIDQAEDEES